MSASPYCLKHLTNNDLLSTLKKLVRDDQQLAAELLAHLAEVDTRELFLNEAAPSLYAYCTDVLHFSEGAAYKRVHAARAARAYPEIFDMVARGELHVSSVVLLAPRLTPENHGELLQAARYQSKRAIEEMLAARFPKPDVPTILRKLPSKSVVAPLLLAPTTAPASLALGALPSAANAGFWASCAPSAKAPQETASASLPMSTAVTSGPGSRGELSALSRDRYRLQVTLSTETRDKLLRARDLLRHKQPDGDLAVVLDEALSRLCDELERQKFGKKRGRARKRADAEQAPGPAQQDTAALDTSSPEAAREQPSEPSPSRDVPRAVRRAVSERDGYQCSFVAADGRRCPARSMLEFHHIKPYAKGGTATLENTTLRCRGHNRHAAVLDFGTEAVQAGIAASQRRRSGSPPAP
jgi:5-methylcytosine-specific restriction endonuclease McrA